MRLTAGQQYSTRATDAAVGMAVSRGPRKRAAMKPGRTRPGIPRVLVIRRRLTESKQVEGRVAVAVEIDLTAITVRYSAEKEEKGTPVVKGEI